MLKLFSWLCFQALVIEVMGKLCNLLRYQLFSAQPIRYLSPEIIKLNLSVFLSISFSQINISVFSLRTANPAASMAQPALKVSVAVFVYESLVLQSEVKLKNFCY